MTLAISSIAAGEDDNGPACVQTRLQLLPQDRQRAWDFGIVDSDCVAFPICEPADEESWSIGRLRDELSYWHERGWIRWRISGRINYFTVAEFRAVPSIKTATKGVPGSWTPSRVASS